MWNLGLLGASLGFSSDFELIQTSIVSGTSTTSVVFDVSSFASTYKHLQIRGVAKSSNTARRLSLRLNGNTGANYSSHFLYSNQSSVISGAVTSDTSISLLTMAGSGQDVSIFTPFVTDLLDFSSSTKNKTTRTLNGSPGAGLFMGLYSGAFYSIEPVTSITILPIDNNLVAGSRFSLYGIKGE
jgi:hypothetical protein